MKEIKSLEYSKLEELLEGIEKPGRYIDHEIGTSSKKPEHLGSRQHTCSTCLSRYL